MNGEDFYSEFKEALRFLQSSWGEKQHVTVWCEGDSFHMASDGREIKIALPKESTS